MNGETEAECKARRKEEDSRPEMIALFKQRESDSVYSTLSMIGVPGRALSFANKAEDTTAIRAITGLGSEGMLVLSGKVGCGKTVAAAKWILDYVMDKERWKATRVRGRDDETIDYKFTFFGSALWSSSSKISRIDHYSESEISDYKRCDRLVIDDLSAEYMDVKGFYLALLDEIINERYANKKGTVLTTNCDVVGFKEKYGERIVDRIREAGRFFGCGNESMRRKL